MSYLALMYIRTSILHVNLPYPLHHTAAYGGSSRVEKKKKGSNLSGNALATKRTKGPVTVVGVIGIACKRCAGVIIWMVRLEQ